MTLLGNRYSRHGIDFDERDIDDRYDDYMHEKKQAENDLNDLRMTIRDLEEENAWLRYALEKHGIQTDTILKGVN